MADRDSDSRDLGDLGSATDSWLTTMEVAALLRVHHKHVYRLLQQGMPAKRLGGQWRFSHDAIVKWAQKRGTQLSAQRSSEATTNAIATPNAEAETATKSTDPTRADPDSDAALVAVMSSEIASEIIKTLSSTSQLRLATIATDRGQALELLTNATVAAALVASSHDAFVQPPRDFSMGAYTAPIQIDTLRVYLGSLAIGLIEPSARSSPRLSPNALASGASTPFASELAVAACPAMQLAAANVLQSLAPASILTCPTALDACATVVCGRAGAAVGPESLATRFGLCFTPIATQAWWLVARVSSMQTSSISRLLIAAQSEPVLDKLRSILPLHAQNAGKMTLETAGTSKLTAPRRSRASQTKGRPNTGQNTQSASLGDSSASSVADSQANLPVVHWTLLQRQRPDQMLQLVQALRSRGLRVGGFLQMPSGPASQKPLGYDLYRLSRPERVALAERLHERSRYNQSNAHPSSPFAVEPAGKPPMPSPAMPSGTPPPGGESPAPHCELSFHFQALERAGQWLRQDLATSDLVIVDGVGRLEQQGKGLFSALAWVRAQARPKMVVLASSRGVMSQLASRLQLSSRLVTDFCLDSDHDSPCPSALIDHLVRCCTTHENASQPNQPSRRGAKS